MWQELAIALSLVLVIEGILPFLNPAAWRLMAYRLADMENRAIRLAGLSSMAAGLVLLSLLK
ncbi:DUF2065 family protein [Spongiibacter sp. KMU-158]|uniref:DUF2065 family protein n=1 Tax=Spongiibacter pelagi TaxID=2760804 RepID=A0A927BYI7_9GAMM|nr:DUF2065 family protein [Spongiibacter pelagi]MBD2857910.1 DUF2065 family protein [Spongiibacter pelagi]